MEETIENKVAKSGLITIDLEDFYTPKPILKFDLTDYLYEGIMLKEKDFREKIANTDWTKYKGAYVYIHTSADVLIPNWAYMIISSKLAGEAEYFMVGDEPMLIQYIFTKVLAELDLTLYAGQKLVIKGCGSGLVGAYVYAEITRLLSPYAQSIMYGEPCSTVPVYKRK